jgi:DNA (cytosine-5)-methyltransferase 1
MIKTNETKLIKIRQATKQGWIYLKSGGVCDMSYPTSKLRRGRVQGGGDICPTLTSSNIGIYRVEVIKKK